MERSRRPRSSPGQVSAEIEEAIVRLRKELRVDNGAQSDRLSAGASQDEAVPSVATIHRVLVRRGMVTPQPHKRPKVSLAAGSSGPDPTTRGRSTPPRWALADGQTVWIMDVLDDHSRVLVAARRRDRADSQAAWEAFTTAVLEWGLPAQVMSDNGSCFTGRLP